MYPQSLDLTELYLFCEESKSSSCKIPYVLFYFLELYVFDATIIGDSSAFNLDSSYSRILNTQTISKINQAS